MENHQQYDVIIIGGGMVGASLAIALGNQKCRIAVIESVPFRSSLQPSYNDRSIALAYGSKKIFATMGLWGSLQSHVEAIHKIHISDRGHFGATRLDCRDENVEALGYVVDTRSLGKVLLDRLEQLENVDLLCPAELVDVDITEHSVTAHIREGSCDREGKKKGHKGNGNGVIKTISASLLVAADGSQSMIREQLDIPVTCWEYGQTAVIANITPQDSHQNIAYERFTDTGPLAILPLPSHVDSNGSSDGKEEPRCSLVWTVRDEQLEDILSLSDEEFLGRLQQRFGQRLGCFLKVGTRHAYPLTMLRANEDVRSRVALIGNAAHTLHPVAGQGFNLGVRDVAALAEVLVHAIESGQDIGSLSILQEYADWRRRDHRRVIAFTDGLARIFSNRLSPVKMARNLGLLAVDLAPFAKHGLTRQTMGLTGRLPRLARGLPLV